VEIAGITTESQEKAQEGNPSAPSFGVRPKSCQRRAILGETMQERSGGKRKKRRGWSNGGSSGLKAGSGRRNPNGKWKRNIAVESDNNTLKKAKFTGD